jgi:hypothetical protein
VARSKRNVARVHADCHRQRKIRQKLLRLRFAEPADQSPLTVANVVFQIVAPRLNVFAVLYEDRVEFECFLRWKTTT